MTTTPGSIQAVEEVQATTIGDQAPTPAAGSLTLFSNQNGTWYSKTSAGVVTALSGVTSIAGLTGPVIPQGNTVVASAGALEAAHPVTLTALTGASKAWALGDFGTYRVRSNSGTAMTDTFPAASTVTNGRWITISNTDTTATLTLTAASSTFGTGGASSFTIQPGRRTTFISDGVSSYQPWTNNNNLVRSTGTIVAGHVAVYTDTTGINIQDGGAFVASVTNSDGTIGVSGTSAVILTRPAITGDVTIAGGSNTSVLANIPNDAPAAGDVLFTTIAQPSNPPITKARVYVDSTSKNLAVKSDTGTVNHGIQTKAAVAHQFLTSVNDDGSSVLAQPATTDLSGLGTGVATALGVNVGTAGSVLVNGGALGTPSSGTLTNASGLPISTGVSGLAAGIATFLGTPSSANLAAALTDETGSGAAVFANASVLKPKDIEGRAYVDSANTQGWSGSDAGAWINSAFAYLLATYGTATVGGVSPAGFTGAGVIILAPGVYTFTTPIVCADQWFSIKIVGAGEGIALTPTGTAGKGGTVLNYTPTSGIAMTIAGASSNNGGVQIEDFALFGGAVGTNAVVPGGTAIGIQWGLTGGSPPPGSSTAGATAKNVSVIQFATGENWNSTGSIAYAVTHINCKVQYCASGAIPFGEANSWYGGLFGNNTVHVVGSNNGTDANFFGTAFDDHVTNAINISQPLFRCSLQGSRFENAGGGNESYIVQSAGSISMTGGSIQTDAATGTATQFITQTGGISRYDSVWFYTGGRTVTSIVNATSPAIVTVNNPLYSTAATAGTLGPVFNAGYVKRIVTGTVTSTTAKTQIVSAPIGANALPTGQTYRIEAYGTQSSTAGTATVDIHVGTANTTADAIVATVAVPMASNGGLAMRGLITIRTLGGSGTAFGSVMGVGTTTVLSTTTTTTTVNTSAANFVTLSIAASAGTTTMQTAIIVPEQP